MRPHTRMQKRFTTIALARRPGIPIQPPLCRFSNERSSFLAFPTMHRTCAIHMVGGGLSMRVQGPHSAEEDKSLFAIVSFSCSFLIPFISYIYSPRIALRSLCPPHSLADAIQIIRYEQDQMYITHTDYFEVSSYEKADPRKPGGYTCV